MARVGILVLSLVLEETLFHSVFQARMMLAVVHTNPYIVAELFCRCSLVSIVR